MQAESAIYFYRILSLSCQGLFLRKFSMNEKNMTNFRNGEIKSRFYSVQKTILV